MGILDNIDKTEIWEEFLQYKTDGGHLSKREEVELRAFIQSEGYKTVAADIRAKKSFSYPVLSEINKKNTQKKRKVFIFEPEENYILKLIAYLLGKYDYLFCSNLYSFRRDIGVKRALSDILKRHVEGLYSYKADVSDYFNSADTNTAVSLMKEALKDDEELACFIERILREPLCISEGRLVSQKKGIMAGVPVSGFLANLYLSGLDELFEKEGAIYARYSDDIIVFAETPERISRYEKVINDFISARGLAINQGKQIKTSPGQAWEFLGFSVEGRTMDISCVSLRKIKAKIKRKAKALARWKSRNGASDERAVRAFIKFLNRKFYDNPFRNEITWTRWYFPTITTARSLKKIDEYAVQCIRYIAAGRYSKSNYNLRYSVIKSFGYRNLVNNFYKFKNNLTQTEKY